MTNTIRTKITRQDLKIYPSERLTQTDDGGGMPLGKPLTGALNELFKPIGSVARLNGAFYAVLEYMGVLRPDNEPLIAPFACITRPPNDPTVSYLLFKATRFGESRAEILKRIEAYNVPTVESRMTLMSNQSAGAKVIQAYQTNGEPLPMVGDIYCLSQTKAGYPSATQFIQVSRVDSENRKFNDGQKDIYKTVVKLEITNPLKADFIGATYPKDGYADVPCKILETGVADAGQYYGVKLLAVAIEKAVQKIQVTAIMEKLVPVNQVENALVDVNISTTPIALDVAYGEILDNGVKQSSILTANVPVQSYIEYVKPNIRSYTYTAQLLQPRKGSVTAKYLAQGMWYELKDDGNGKLVGASSAYGAGTIDYKTGSMTLSCGELPDVNSAIIVLYAKDVYQKPTATIKAYLPIQLGKRGNQITVSNNGKTGTVVGDTITGGITGEYDITNNVLKLDPTISRGDIVVSYIDGTVVTETPTPTIANNLVKFTTSQKPVAKGAYFTAVFGSGSTEVTKTIYEKDGVLYADDVNMGTANLATGEFSFNNSFDYTYHRPIYEQVKVGENKIYASDGKTYTTENIYGQNLVRTDKITETVSFKQFGTGVTYQVEGGSRQQQTFATPNMTVELGTTQAIVDNSLYFTLGSILYRDVSGKIMQGQNVVGTRTGSIATLTDFVMASPTLNGLLVKTGDDDIKQLVFTTPKIRPASLKLNIYGYLANSNLKNEIWLEQNPNALNMPSLVGSINSDIGLGHLTNLNAIKPKLNNDITYQAVALSYLPIDTNIVKIDTVRLPPDGRVPIFRRGDDILISNRKVDNLGSAFTGGQTINLSRGDLDRICINDADNQPVNAELWDYDLDKGSITFKTTIDLSAYKMPLSAVHTREERNALLQVDIDGTLSLKFPTKRAYAIEDTFVSSMLLHDDLQVRVSVPFTQRNWKNIWQDTPDGDQLLNKLKLTDYPMILTDDGAITDRWMIKFTSGSQFELYSEALGFVGKFDTLTNLAPINPATGKPYFTIDKRAFGTDTPWATQDVIRFNTWGTLMPVWVLCAVQPNPNPPTGTDGFEQYLFGDTTEIIA